MAYKNLVYIWNSHDSEWVALKQPSSYVGISTTLVDSARNSDGVFIGDVIKSDIAKIEMTWNFLTTQEYSDMMKLFESKYNGSFLVQVCFFDTIKGDWDGSISSAPSSTNVCRTFYPNDRTGEFAEIQLDETTGSPIGYKGVSLHLIDTGK